MFSDLQRDEEGAAIPSHIPDGMKLGRDSWHRGRNQVKVLLESAHHPKRNTSIINEYINIPIP